MPLVTRAAAAYALGLAVGLCTDSAIASIAAGTALLLAVLGRRHAAEAAVAVVLAGGVLVAMADVSRRAQCAATLGRVHEWSVSFETRAAPGGMARGTLAAGGCSAHVACGNGK